MWRVVDAVAAGVGVPSPDELTTELEVSACVMQAGPKRVLMLGLPLLEVLPVDQLRAVIAHELGHFASGDTRADARTGAIESAMDEAMRSSGFGGPAIWAYRLLYRAAAGLHSRARERAADIMSVEVAGTDATLAALRSVGRIAVIDEEVGRRTSMFFRAHLRAPVGEAYRALLAADPVAVETRLEEFLKDEAGSINDSHPPLADRIEAISALPRVEQPADGTPAASLLGLPESDLEGRLLARQLPLTDWASVARAAGQEEVLLDSLSIRDFSQVDNIDPTLAGLLDWLETDDRDPDGVEWATWLLPSMVRSALYERGLASAVDVSWSLDEELIWDEQVPGIVDAWTEALAGRTERLRELLTAAGVDASVPPAKPRSDWLLAVRSHVWSRGQVVDAYLFRTGLLLLPSVKKMPGHERFERVNELPFEAAKALPDARWVAVEDIASISLLGERIKLRSGERIRLREMLGSLDLPDEDEVDMAFDRLRDELR